MRKTLPLLASFALALLAGCYATVHIDKRPSIALPIYKSSSPNSNTNEVTNWIIVDQGYEVTYSKRGFNTEIQSMRAEITTNRTVVFSLGGLHSTSCYTNSIQLRVEDLFNFIKTSRECPTNEVLNSN